MKPDWKQILKILIAVLTALAGAIGVASCVP
ncbi:MAG: smalltalk protein [Bacteroidaceae bacterium]|nr:smalltalk protein [Bacteroidaceae bacterium]